MQYNSLKNYKNKNIAYKKILICIKFNNIIYFTCSLGAPLLTSYHINKNKISITDGFDTLKI